MKPNAVPPDHGVLMRQNAGVLGVTTDDGNAPFGAATPWIRSVCACGRLLKSQVSFTVCPVLRLAWARAPRAKRTATVISTPWKTSVCFP